MKPHTIAKMGLIRTFQLVRTFLKMKVLDNVLVAIYATKGVLKGIPEYDAVDKAMYILDMVGLKHRAKELAESLPHGERKKLELARALATDPVMLLLDEPTSGLTDREIRDLLNVVMKFKEEGVTISIIEHNVRVIMGISDRILALSSGEVIAEGTPEEIARNERVIKAYLGERYALRR